MIRRRFLAMLAALPLVKVAGPRTKVHTITATLVGGTGYSLVFSEGGPILKPHEITARLCDPSGYPLPEDHS
jgi:hypothetical protein